MYIRSDVNHALRRCFVRHSPWSFDYFETKKATYRVIHRSLSTGRQTVKFELYSDNSSVTRAVNGAGVSTALKLPLNNRLIVARAREHYASRLPYTPRVRDAVWPRLVRRRRHDCVPPRSLLTQLTASDNEADKGGSGKNVPPLKTAF